MSRNLVGGSRPLLAAGLLLAGLLFGAPRHAWAQG